MFQDPLCPDWLCQISNFVVKFSAAFPHHFLVQRNPTAAQVGRDLEKSSGPAFLIKEF